MSAQNARISENLGRECAALGLPRNPGQDPEMTEICADMRCSTIDTLHAAWLRGYDAEIDEHQQGGSR